MVESLSQFEFLTETYPEFEPSLVAFRIDALKQTITTLGAQFTGDDQQIANRHTEFIKLMVKAADQRDSASRSVELDTRRLALQKLNQVIEIRPEQYTQALKTQSLRLQESITWLERKTGDPARSITPKLVFKRPPPRPNQIATHTPDLPSGPGLAPTNRAPSLFPKR